MLAAALACPQVHDRLRRVIAGVLHHADEATVADVLQTTFVHALRGAGGFDGRARASTWLHRVAVNAALLHLRGGRGREFVDVNGLDIRGGYLDVEVTARLRFQETRRALRKLRPLDYQIMLLCADGVTCEEIATRFEMHPQAIRTRISRARQRLRELMGDQYG